MARIIPWTLPPVNGGSQGGYTPQPTPTPSANYYEFNDVEFGSSSQENYAYFDQTNGNWTARSGYALHIDMIPVNLVGVSQVNVVLSGTFTGSGETSDTIILTLDPSTLTVISMALPGAKVGGGSQSGAITEYNVNILNGNGEILQTFNKVIE